MLERAKRLYEIWRHRAGTNPETAFEYLGHFERQAWLEIAEQPGLCCDCFDDLDASRCPECELERDL